MKSIGYNEHGEFYVLKDYCSFKRKEPWGEGLDQTDKLRAINQELRMQYGVLLYGVMSPKLLDTLKIVAQQGIDPLKVVIAVLKLEQPDIDQLSAILATEYKFKEWSIENLVEYESAESYFHRSLFHHITPWTMCVDSEKGLMPKFVEQINKVYWNGPSNYVAAVDPYGTKFIFNKYYRIHKTWPEEQFVYKAIIQ